MTQSLRVVQLLPALNAGGVERGTLEVARALVDAGHRAEVVSAGGGMLRELEACGARHTTLPIGRKSLGVLRCIRPLRRIIQGADIVHARSRLPAWVGRLALRGIASNKPHWITTVHGLNSVSRYSEVMLSGERVICVSESVRAYLRRHYPGVVPSRLVVIPRGIDPARWPHGFEPTPSWRREFVAEFPLLETNRVLCLPGRLTRLKGHDYLVNLVAELVARGLPVAALIVGGGGRHDQRIRQRLVDQARRLGVADRILFTGLRKDVREIMAISDLVLSLSRKPEAFGRTVLEALSLGRPVVGFDHGGVGELLNAIYPSGAVPPCDGARLADRVESVLAQPAPVPASHSYTLARMLESTLGLYRTVAQG